MPLLKHLRTAALTLLLFTLLTGLLYPLAVTGLAQLLFPGKANGSLLLKKDGVRGSELIGQPFTSPRYFWGRLSATARVPYNAASSGGSNVGPLNPALLDPARKRMRDLKLADPGNGRPVPVDLVTASASGLDPHISIAAALYQLPRVARARNTAEEDVRCLIDRHTEGRTLGLLGEPRVNVLELNLALDEIKNTTPGK